MALRVGLRQSGNVGRRLDIRELFGKSRLNRVHRLENKLGIGSRSCRAILKSIWHSASKPESETS
jgi:hypothetical protein